jgi:hypothetical protein
MTTSKYINADKILRVEVRLSKSCSQYRWVDAAPAKKWLWWITQPATPAGWLDSSYVKILQEEDILRDNRIFKRTDVLREYTFWEKASVIIESIGGKYTNSDYVHFEKDEDAIAYAQEISNQFPHIQITYPS